MFRQLVGKLFFKRIQKGGDSKFVNFFKFIISDKIRREETAKYYQCAAELDSTQHTLQESPAWAFKRELIGRDLSPTVSIAAMLAGEEG